MLQTNILLFMILFIYNCSSILMYEIYNLQHMKFKGLFNLCIFLSILGYLKILQSNHQWCKLSFIGLL